MGTKWSEIVTNYAMTNIDDVRLQEDAANDPAAFLRRMSLYMENAIPLFSLPVQMREYLRDGLVMPLYGDVYWDSTAESLQKETVVETGMVGYELFSCAAVEQTPDGSVVKEFLGEEDCLPALAAELGGKPLLVRAPGAQTPFAMAKTLCPMPRPEGWLGFAFD